MMATRPVRSKILEVFTLRVVGPGSFWFVQNSVCLYHMLEANAICHRRTPIENSWQPQNR